MSVRINIGFYFPFILIMASEPLRNSHADHYSRDVSHRCRIELEANQPGKPKGWSFCSIGEFGRQLSAYGNYGTDHGVGNYAVLIGDRINSGV